MFIDQVMVDFSAEPENRLRYITNSMNRIIGIWCTPTVVFVKGDDNGH